MTMDLIEAADKAEACKILADLTEQKLRQELSLRSDATLLFSGGTTPGPAYAILGAADIDWQHVTTGLVDDRWVDVDHPGSNEGLIRRTFLASGAAASSFLPMKLPTSDCEQAAKELSSAYKPFETTDVAILGLGPDGHTASWFPDSVGLEEAMSEEADQPVRYINAEGCPVAGEYPDRMTVTMPVLKNARHVILMLTGEEKRAVLLDSSKDLPIHKLIGARDGDLTVIWAP